ncbi:MAG: PilZ domain-containing protein [Candidatus Omnitrophica bacterium]|nr:PilZ domain-containing protein [Candidatus Omnitrophota bacterium]MDD5488927.1 PilZ domain-containing protein [Candidatus Omnitrophota bacterium]
MYKGIERRTCSRIKRPGEMFLRQYAGNRAGWKSAMWDVVPLADIGAGGARFYHDGPLLKGSLVDIKLNVVKGMPPLECIGKVIRVKDMPGTGAFELAASFVEMPGEKKDLIDKEVESFTQHGW